MLLYHRKMVAVVGMSRGGTNIVWNILQSHPQLGAPIREFTANFNPTENARFRTLIDFVIGNKLLLNPPLNRWVGGWIDRQLYESKMQGLSDIYAKQKYENVVYQKEELSVNDVIVKFNDRDMYAVDLMGSVYDEFYLILLVRNGYALAESWKRRGHSATKTAKRYQHYVNLMLDMQARYENTLLVKFEDVLANPFEQAEKMFRFAHLDPPSLDKLRLKTKHVIKQDGTYESAYGGYGAKHWFTQETISDIIKPDQSAIQADLLDEMDKQSFNLYAGEIMQKLGYS